jgi:Lon protease-like protein
MPDAFPVFPLSTVLFPGGILPLHVFEERYRTMTKKCLSGDGRFGVVLISRGSEVGGGDERTGVGTVAQILRASALPDGRSALLVRGTERFKVVDWLVDEPYPRAFVDPFVDQDDGDDLSVTIRSAAASVRRARVLLSELEDVPVPTEELPSDERAQCWTLCDRAPVTVLDRQRLLECDGTRARLSMLIELCEAVAEDLARLMASS